jgi:hypothetical protein
MHYNSYDDTNSHAFHEFELGAFMWTVNIFSLNCSAVNDFADDDFNRVSIIITFNEPIEFCTLISSVVFFDE